MTTSSRGLGHDLLRHLILFDPEIMEWDIWRLMLKNHCSTGNPRDHAKNIFYLIHQVLCYSNYWQKCASQKNQWTCQWMYCIRIWYRLFGADIENRLVRSVLFHARSPRHSFHVWYALERKSENFQMMYRKKFDQGHFWWAWPAIWHDVTWAFGISIRSMKRSSSYTLKNE